MPLLLRLSSLLPPPGLGHRATTVTSELSHHRKHVSKSKRRRDALRACAHWARHLSDCELASVSGHHFGSIDCLRDVSSMGAASSDRQGSERSSVRRTMGTVLVKPFIEALGTGSFPFACFYRLHSSVAVGVSDSGGRQRSLFPLPLVTELPTTSDGAEGLMERIAAVCCKQSMHACAL